MAFGDADLAYLLGHDFGVDVTYGGVTVKGQLDAVDESILTGHSRSQIGVARSVAVATGSISPAQTATITVDGVDYRVIDVSLEGPDGRLSRIGLAG